MIPILIIFVPIIIATTFYLTKKIHSVEKKICLRVLLLNMFLLVLLKLILPSIIFLNTTILFWIIILINIVLLILLLNSKIPLNKKTAIVLLVIYFSVMILTPTYKYEGHKHTFTNGVETINRYSEYYNCYGIKLKIK